MTTDAHIPQEDLALYAMQALSAEEAAFVRAHLSHCGACSDELAAVLGDLALVAMNVEGAPLPAGAQQRFKDRIAASAANPEMNAESSPRVISIPRKRGIAPLHNWLPWAIAAALLIVSVALDAKIHTLNERLRQQTALAARQAAESTHAQEVLDVLTAPSAQHVLLVSGKARPEPSGRAVYLAESGSLIFQANNLEPLPEGKTYELWVIPATGKAPIPAGLFRPDGLGSASVILPALPKGVPAKAFGVTIEKAEGSTTPTAPIVLAGTAPSAGS
jgi:hypothetical protein